MLLFSAALFPMWYVSSLYLQQVLGLSPLATGFAFLPMALVIFLCASRAGQLVGRFGVRAVLGSGLVIMCQRDAAVRSYRPERQRRDLHRAAGHPHRHRHRPVDRALDHLRHPGRGPLRRGWLQGWSTLRARPVVAWAWPC